MPLQTFNCPKCNTALGANLPQPEISNLPKASVVVATHEKGTECVKCHLYFVIAVNSAQLEYAIVAIEKPKEQGSNIISPSGISH